MAPQISEADIAAIRETLSHFVSGVTGGSKIDENALTVTNIYNLRASVLSELDSTSLREHLNLLGSKDQLNLACYVAADFANAQSSDYQVVHAMLNIFFWHVEDLLDKKPEVLQNFQLRLATGEPLGDPVLDWYARELIPLLWKYFEPLVANMIIVACYDFVNGVGVELLTQDATVHTQAPQFPEWLRIKTGLSPMYALLALAPRSDARLLKEAGGGGLDKYVQTIPDIVVFTNVVNDVISFYKEFCAGERGNYIDMRAEKDGVDVITAQRTLADEGIAAYRRVISTLADEPEYCTNFKNYARGITHFHTSSPRYRLRELFKDLGQAERGT